MNSYGRLSILSVLLLACPTALPAADDLFERVVPILEQHCVRCHQESPAKGGLNLAGRDSALRGGESGPAIVPGRPDESLLMEYVSGDKPEMPKNAPPLARRAGRKSAPLDRVRSPVAGQDLVGRQASGRPALVVTRAGGPTVGARDQFDLGTQRDRSFYFGDTARAKARAVARGRPPHAHPPPDVRSARPAADRPRKSRRFCADS